MGPIRWGIVLLVLAFLACIVFKPEWIANVVDPAAESTQDRMTNTQPK